MATQKGIESWKAKKWFTVYAPKFFGDVAIGEMPGKDEKAVIGRNIVVSLDSMTHNPQNANMNIVLKVGSVDGDKAATKLMSMELLFSFIRTLVRRYKSVSATVVKAKTKDGIAVVVKPIVITVQRSTASRINAIRKEMGSFVGEYVAKSDIDAVVKSIAGGTLQQEMHTKLNHIAPLSKAEIKKLEIMW